jgi:hypothetical protein
MAAPGAFHAHMVELGKSVDGNPDQRRIGGDLDRIGLFAGGVLRVGVLWFQRRDSGLIGAHVALENAAGDDPSRILDVLDVPAHYGEGGGDGSRISAEVPTDPRWKGLASIVPLRSLHIHERGGTARLQIPDVRSNASLAEADRVLATGAVLLRVDTEMEFAGQRAALQTPFYDKN